MILISNDYWHERKMYNFEPYNVLLVIAAYDGTLLLWRDDCVGVCVCVCVSERHYGVYVVIGIWAVSHCAHTHTHTLSLSLSHTHMI